MSNPAHIVTGAVGEHVSKIQQALLQLDGTLIESSEVATKRFGPSTARAVLAFKSKRSIVNRSYQSTADNIVGIMTMAALDHEMTRRIDPVVTIGSLGVNSAPRVVGPIQPFAPSGIGGGAAGPVMTTLLRSVVRGNPYVPFGALTTDAMPDSIPPSKTYAVQVTIEPPLDTTSQFIELSVINTGGGNGTATVAQRGSHARRWSRSPVGRRPILGVAANCRFRRSWTAVPLKRHRQASASAPTRLTWKQLSAGISTATLLSDSS